MGHKTTSDGRAQRWPEHAPSNPSFLGQGHKLMLCLGELRHAFQDGPWCDSGRPAYGNIIMDTVVREWSDLEGEELDKMMDALFAIFYVDEVNLAAQDPNLLQRAIDGLVGTLEHVGLKTNTLKTKAMTCTPGKIWLQLPADSYRWMRTGCTLAIDWDAHTVTCRECGKDMRVGSLGRHLADIHEIYQGWVVAKELLN
jgi:hypothetical protein